jgi:DNA-binding response OmpR family regulator
MAIELHPDIIITDIRMPQASGLDMIRDIEAYEPHTEYILISGYADFEYAKRAMEYGVQYFLTKPIDEEELLLRIKALLRRARIGSERPIVIGDVELDYDTMTITRGDEVQVLPQKEFLLLFKLLSYPGKIFTRIQLMDEIWGNESETGWETVTVHIGRLRKRFEGWEEFELQSVRGLGYRAVKKT